MKNTILGAIAALGLTVSTAEAATFKFDGNGSSSNQASFEYEVDGLKVSVTAGTYGNPNPVGSPISNFNETTIDLNSWGLISDRDGRGGDEHVVDGRRGNEVILFDFGSKLVELTDARFRWTTSTYYCDEYDMYGRCIDRRFDANAKFDFFADGIFIGRSTYAAAANIFDGVVGSVFGIGASKKNTGFKLAGISAEEVAPVPLPASSLLLIAGLGGLGMMRRKAK